MQEHDLSKAAFNFIEITPMHRQGPKNLQHICRTTPPGEHLWGTASAWKKNFKRLKLLKLYTVVKRNLLALKINK